MSGSPIWHPFTQHGLGEPIPLIARAEGAVLWTLDGRRIIDAISSWWVTTHGHRHPRIMAAIAEQAERLDQIIFAGWTHEPAEAVARGLTRIMPRELTRVFFSDSGSTSVEVALKMALGYWHWAFLAQPAPLPERLIGADPDAFFDLHVRALGLGAAPDRYPPDLMAAYRELLDDPGTVEAICEDYRAGAGIDREHDEADRGRRHIECPLLALWSARGALPPLPPCRRGRLRSSCSPQQPVCGWGRDE